LEDCLYDAGDRHEGVGECLELSTPVTRTLDQRDTAGIDSDLEFAGACARRMVTDHGFGDCPVRQENGLHSINISLHALPLRLAGGEEVSDVVLGKSARLSVS